MLSIVIPAMNESKRLPRLLDSIKQQSFRDFEIIVADANSTDNTREIAKQYNARIVNGGLPGVGRNRGVEVAYGDLILFLDADVVLPDLEWLERVVDEFNERKLGIASFPVKSIDGAFGAKAYFGFWNLYQRMFGSLLAHTAGFCMMSSISVHNSINGFDEEIFLAEDQDYVRRAVKKGYKFGVIKSAYILVSSRRFSRDGYFKTAIKYILGELYMVFVGPIKKDIFKYTFGHEE